MQKFLKGLTLTLTVVFLCPACGGVVSGENDCVVYNNEEGNTVVECPQESPDNQEVGGDEIGQPEIVRAIPNNPRYYLDTNGQVWYNGMRPDCYKFMRDHEGEPWCLTAPPNDEVELND